VSRCRSHVKKLRYLPTLRRKGKAEIGATRDWENAYGGGGIPPTHAKKFSVAMVKRNFFVVNEQFVDKPFCQCHWKI